MFALIDLEIGDTVSENQRETLLALFYTDTPNITYEVHIHNYIYYRQLYMLGKKHAGWLSK